MVSGRLETPRRSPRDGRRRDKVLNVQLRGRRLLQSPSEIYLLRVSVQTRRAANKECTRAAAATVWCALPILSRSLVE